MLRRLFVPISVIFLAILALMAVTFSRDWYRDQSYALTQVTGNDPLPDFLSPLHVFEQVKGGRWSVGVYLFGVRCRCGLFMSRGASGHVLVHHLGNDDDSFVSPRPRPLYVYPYEEAPQWVTAKAEAIAKEDRDYDPNLIAFVEIRSRSGRILFQGFDGNPEEPANTDADEEDDAMAMQYLRDQYRRISWYRLARTPLGLRR